MLGHSTPRAPTIQRPSPLPYELVELVIVHIASDIRALKACSLTCYTWYTAAVPHLHHTFVFRKADLGEDHDGLKSLSRRHALGLLPFAREIRILQPPTQHRWFLPQSFGRKDLRYFSAFTNVQSLTLQQLDIHSFIPGIERYFGHLSPTVRSITLESPRCTPRQLSHFLSLFTNLDDIKVQLFVCLNLPGGIPDDALVPFSTPKLQGRLTLSSSPVVDTWKDLAALSGLRFRSIYLYPVSACAPVLLSACAETLETLRIAPESETGKGPRLDLITSRG